MVTLDDRFLDRAVRALDLAIGQGCLIWSADVRSRFAGIAHRTYRHVSCLFCRLDHPHSAGEGEPDPIVGEHRVDLIGDRRDQSFEEGCGCGPSRLPDQLHEGELVGAIDGDVEVELAFDGLEFGDFDVEIADRISLEHLLEGLPPSTSGNRLMLWRWQPSCL